MNLRSRNTQQDCYEAGREGVYKNCPFAPINQERVVSDLPELVAATYIRVCPFTWHRLTADLSHHRHPGAWSAELRLAGGLLRKLTARVTKIDPVAISARSGRFHPSLSLPGEFLVCTENQSTRVPNLTPANPEHVDIPLVPSRGSTEEIEGCSAEPPTSDAEARLEDLYAKAAAISESHRVETAEIGAFCEPSFEGLSRRSPETYQASIRQVMPGLELLAPLGVEPVEINDLMDSRLRSAWKR